MTTTVTITTHTWPVEVESADLVGTQADGSVRLAKTRYRVEPNQVHQECVHSTRTLQITELATDAEQKAG